MQNNMVVPIGTEPFSLEDLREDWRYLGYLLRAYRGGTSLEAVSNQFDRKIDSAQEDLERIGATIEVQGDEIVLEYLKVRLAV